ncbi:hypothetical protein BDZ94DRAFT_1238635 [Collybia nuda]|uniref:Uncharacterized protein n=1 Tax=Collybia nuda TaxID=64659 RepID=A0A9P5Y2J6_9AGAR|nr:hypothetical protein BDZ94DRAFT_1238635 [Collybia nuda]
MFDVNSVFQVHRKDMKVLFDKGNHRSKVGSILAILVTTGIALSINRVMYIIIGFYPIPSSYTLSVLSNIYFGFEVKLSLIHPTLTIVLVNMENNLEQQSIINALLLPIHSVRSQNSRVSTQDQPWAPAFAIKIDKGDSVVYRNRLSPYYIKYQDINPGVQRHKTLVLESDGRA